MSIALRGLHPHTLRYRALHLARRVTFWLAVKVSPLHPHTLRYRALHLTRRVTFCLAVKVSPALFASLYFRAAFACLRERRRMIGFTDDSSQSVETKPN